MQFSANHMYDRHNGSHQGSVDEIGDKACNKCRIRDPKSADDIPQDKSVIEIEENLAWPDPILSLVYPIFYCKQRYPGNCNDKSQR